MKIVLALATLALSAVAHASPAVGDTAAFDGTLTQGSQSTGVHVTVALTQFDPAKNAYLEVQTVTAASGRSKTDQAWVATTDLLDDAIIGQVLADCAGQGGTSESLTVPAGTFNTCRIEQQDGTVVNVGAVPFGIIKQANAQLSISLSSFTAGH